MTTRDEIIAMARDAAAKHGHTFKAEPQEETIEFIIAFHALVAAKERQRLAADVSLSTPEAWMYFHNRACPSLSVQLEEPDCIKSFDTDVTWKKPLHTADQLRDYGDRRAAAAIEQCAKFCSGKAGTDCYDASTANYLAEDLRARGAQQ